MATEFLGHILGFMQLGLTIWMIYELLAALFCAFGGHSGNTSGISSGDETDPINDRNQSNDRSSSNDNNEGQSDLIDALNDFYAYLMNINRNNPRNIDINRWKENYTRIKQRFDHLNIQNKTGSLEDNADINQINDIVNGCANELINYQKKLPDETLRSRVISIHINRINRNFNIIRNNGVLGGMVGGTKSKQKLASLIFIIQQLLIISNKISQDNSDVEESEENSAEQENSEDETDNSQTNESEEEREETSQQQNGSNEENQQQSDRGNENREDSQNPLQPNLDRQQNV
ncbi:MAG: hypothetical protein ACQER9_01215 [Nanobdellota archaeon]